MLETVTARIVVGIAGCLVVGTLVRGAMLARRRDEVARERWRSLGTWWVLFGLMAAMMLLGRTTVVLVMAAGSLLALREGLRLTAAARAFPVAAAFTAGLYFWAWADWRSLFGSFMPVLAVVLVLAEIGWQSVLRPRFARPRGAVIATLEAAVGPSFVVAMASLPPPESLPRESLGWVLLLLLLTELNDMAQAWWGRAFGSRPIAPVLSPHKTWEGFLGGLATTTAVAVLVAPMITAYGNDIPFSGRAAGPPWIWSLALGLLIGFTGLLGDLAVSFLKRRAGVKDSGDLLPGQGGVLDRLDSLALTAPVTFVVTYMLWFTPW